MRIKGLWTIFLPASTAFIASFFCAVAGFGQASGKAAVPGVFDAASIKLTPGDVHGINMGTSHGRFTASNATVRMLIRSAFRVKDFQLSGGPGWLDTERYDIVAKTSNPNVSDEDLWLWLQPMLSDRFRLRFHREVRQLPVYSLVIANGKPKLKTHEGTRSASMTVSAGSGKVRIGATNTTMEGVAGSLSSVMDRIVIDHTGLVGGFDLTLEWAQDRSEEPPGLAALNALEEQLGFGSPSVFTAVKEVGLKLEPAKGPVEVIVIDGVEKATVN